MSEYIFRKKGKKKKQVQRYSQVPVAQPISPGYLGG
jgi:hypothetical protein